MESCPPGMLEALFANAVHLMGVLDAEGRLLAMNGTALKLLGLAREEVLGRPFWETPWWAHDPDSQARVRQAVAAAAAGRSMRLESTYPGADGRMRVVEFSLTPFRDGSGTVRWLFPEGRDITEQKAAEGALRESEEKFRQIFLKSQDGILLLDGDRFVDCNPAVLEMMRCTEPELLRMHPWELSPPTQPDGRPSPDKALEMISLAHAKGGHRFEWMHRRIDGEDFPVEVTLTPFPLGGKEILYTTWRDISERKRDERERLDLERRVLHAQKLESLGILAGGIAHDFNNLMTAMMGRIQLAALELPESHHAIQHLRILEDILERATDLTRQMLAYSGRGKFVVGPVDLCALAREMASLLDASVSKKVELVLDLPEGLPAVEGDAAQLQQVLLNLVTNASDAIGDNPGRIHIAAGVEELDPESAAGLRAEARLRAGTYVFLEVGDTGCGIPHELQGRIFEPFFSTKDTGRGLGLSALLGILRSHRGALRMDSTPGQGTSFRLYFPSAADPARPKNLEAEPPTPLREGLRVLLVDDEANLRAATSEVLRRMGLQVAQAADGLEALERIRAGEAFDLVLLDLMMPRMDGGQALAALRESHPRLPVVLCSGYTEHAVADGLRCTFLPKPYSRAALERAMQQALAQQDQGLER